MKCGKIQLSNQQSDNFSAALHQPADKCVRRQQIEKAGKQNTGRRPPMVANGTPPAMDQGHQRRDGHGGIFDVDGKLLLSGSTSAQSWLVSMMAKDWLQATMEVITEVTMMPPKGVIFLLMDRMRPLTPG